MCEDINFHWRGKRTQAFKGLQWSYDGKGLKVEDLAKGPNYIGGAIKTMEKLREAGLVEIRNSGPRGGKRYHITKQGIKKLWDLKPYG